ncbi:MAG TPA: ester cyclase [Nitrososphaeraceae archaeon]|jgi:predicted ester cyclase|nr:ester cyclase [Nitrososphaeraceae archaeon]
MQRTSGFTGLEDFNATERFLEQNIAGMPDMTADAIRNMSKGDRVLAFILWNGTWTGEAFEMEPTGQVYNATTAGGIQDF